MKNLFVLSLLVAGAAWAQGAPQADSPQPQTSPVQTDDKGNTWLGGFTLGSDQGLENTAFGSGSLWSLQGDRNVALGNNALGNDRWISGNRIVAVGAYSAYWCPWSDSVYVNNQGNCNDTGPVIRIGTQGTQQGAYIAGIANHKANGIGLVVVDADGRLGYTTNQQGVLLSQNASLQATVNSQATTIKSLQTTTSSQAATIKVMQADIAALKKKVGIK